MTAPPVVLFAYNRPELLERVLAPLRAARVPRLYAFSDGPRTAAAAPAVAQVRSILRAIDWVDVELVAHEANQGIASSVLNGVNSVLSRHDRAVVLEDDIELAPGAYEWMAAALERYADDGRVMSVSAWTHPRITPAGLNGQPFFSMRASCWGWATWARAWNGMLDRTAVEMLAAAERAGVPRDTYGHDVVAHADPAYEHWDARLIAHHMAYRGLALHPAESHARHLGWGPVATHQTNRDIWDADLATRAVIPVKWPEPVEHPQTAALWRRAAAAERQGRMQRIGRAILRRASRAGTIACNAPLVAWAALGWAMLSMLRRLPFDDSRNAALPPVRVYWADFLAAHKPDVRRYAAEIGTTSTVMGVGGAAVTRADAIDVASGPGVTVVADLQRAWNVADGQYDVFVNQFSMHMIEDDLAALYHSVRILKPGGVLLANFPCVSSYPWDGVSYGGEAVRVQRWYTPAGVWRMISALRLDGSATVECYGSTFGMLAYAAGVPASAVPRAWLHGREPGVPMLVCVRIERPLDWRPAYVPPRPQGDQR